jgi:hypothetical protein
MSLREDIIKEIVKVLENIDEPKPILVTREPFEAEKLAITQFPALLIQMAAEARESVSMGGVDIGRRTGEIQYQIRGFVRGTELDTKRNDLMEAIEVALDTDRYLGLKSSGVLDSQVTLLEVVPRLAPLAEFIITYRVNYNYLRTSL